MKKKSSSQSAFFKLRLLLGILLCFAGITLVLVAQPRTPSARSGNSQPIAKAEFRGVLPVVKFDISPPLRDIPIKETEGLSPLALGYSMIIDYKSHKLTFGKHLQEEPREDASAGGVARGLRHREIGGIHDGEEARDAAGQACRDREADRAGGPRGVGPAPADELIHADRRHHA